MRIVCLANSRKLTGRCIAGRIWDGSTAGEWIRPVSDRAEREVSEYERQYEDGSDPQPLDIVEIPILEALPDTYQAENWLLDPEYYWEKKGVMEHATLRNLVEPTSPLWIDGHSTYNGENDYVPLSEAEMLQDSLRFVSVSEVNLKVFAPGKAFGNSKRRVQGQFRYAGATYSLWVTDPNQERKWLAQANGEYAIGECYLTISLGEPYEGRVYKLIAAIIEDK
ncbi:MAG: hypothetical protein OXH86_10110 [Acidimicrobiaceae bacterium]|nr:hypothetical protein [Acidimicrobiaceae bacterium]